MTDERIAEIMGWFPIGPDERMTAALRAETLVLLRQIAREAAQEALQGADVLDENNGQFQRKWSSVGSWLMPGQKIVVLGG
jgi:hypothetical protein